MVECGHLETEGTSPLTLQEEVQDRAPGKVIFTQNNQERLFLPGIQMLHSESIMLFTALPGLKYPQSKPQK